jgi:hypothetical protein
MNATYEAVKWNMIARLAGGGLGALAAGVSRAKKAGCPDARRGQILTPCAQKALESLAGQARS